MKRVIVGSAVAATLALACSAIVGIHDLPIGDGGVVDSAVGADASTDAAADVSCDHVVPPAAPQGASLALLEAFKTLELYGTDAAVGYDLDGVCTCHGGPESCVPFMHGDQHCDLPGGQDIEGNATFGQFLEQALSLTAFGDIDARIGAGHLGYLLEILDYNGQPNDTDVLVDFLDSSGLLFPDDAGGIGTGVPSWDGGDRWAVDCALSVADCVPANGAWLGDSGAVLTTA